MTAARKPFDLRIQIDCNFTTNLLRRNTMKVRHFLTALAIAATGSAFAADNHNHVHEHKPMHGGVVVEAKDMDFELVAKPESLQLYVRDHGKPVDISKATAKITVLTGADKQESDLKPQGD